jgi:hypothetical protein
MGICWPTEASGQQTEGAEPDNMDFTDEDMTDDFGPEEPSSYPSLLFDWGLTGLQRAPKAMDLTLWRSHILNGGIFYHIPLGTAPLMSIFGLSVSNADYMFKGKKTLVRDSTNRKVMVDAAQAIIPSDAEVGRCMFSINHIDFTGEFRLNSNKEEPQEGFYISLGGYIGFQLSPTMIIDYKEDNEEKTWINKESFNFNQFRYGVLARAGWNRFGIFYTQGFSNLFKSENNQIASKAIWPWSSGISINLL